MQIPLSQFEQLINPTILKRGLSYFKKGYVDEPEEINNGLYEFLVHGSETYTVRLQLEGEVISSYSCNCPYDLGPVCKHEVACIFHLGQHDLNLEPSGRRERPKRSGSSRTKTAKNKKQKKGKTVKDQVSDTLSRISAEELHQFVLDYALVDPEFRNKLLFAFPEPVDETSTKFYATRIRTLFKGAKGRKGYIDWRQTESLCVPLVELLNQADGFIEKEEYLPAFHICTAILEELTSAFEYTDDSNGVVGNKLFAALSYLQFMSSLDLEKDMHNVLFEYVSSAYDKQIFYGWDWHLSMLECAMLLAESKSEKEMVEQFFEITPSSNYGQARLDQMKLDYLQLNGTAKEIEQYLKEHMDNDELRKQYIDMLILEKNFKEATRLAKEAIEADKRYAMRDSSWYGCLLKIAGASGNTRDIIKYAKHLYIHDHYSKEDYYNILKDHIDAPDWPGFKEELINEIREAKPTDFRRIAFMLDLEGEKQALFDHLIHCYRKRFIDISVLRDYEKRFTPEHTETFADLYEKEVLNYLSWNTGRSHYRRACKWIRWIQKLGEQERAAKLIAHIRQEHPRKPALLDELSNL